MNKAVLAVFMFALLLAPVASAQVFQPVCVNETHLNYSAVFQLNGNTEQIIQEPVHCPHGCNPEGGVYGADCRGAEAPESTSFLGIAAIYIAILAVFFLFARDINIEDSRFSWLFKLVFVLMTFVMMIALAGFAVTQMYIDPALEDVTGLGNAMLVIVTTSVFVIGTMIMIFTLLAKTKKGLRLLGVGVDDG
jgi:hypothetical protein